MVIDGRIVITGSFNFTKAAEEKNAENLLIIKKTLDRQGIHSELGGTGNIHPPHQEVNKSRVRNLQFQQADIQTGGEGRCSGDIRH